MGELFGRTASLQMGTLVVTGLRVQFKIEKTDQPTPSHASITVWNLSRDTRAKMASQTVPVVLMAGYGGDSEQIFNGDIAPSGISVTRSGPDWLTTFKVGDGMKCYQTDRIQFPILKNTNVKDVLAKMLQGVTNADAKQAISDLRSGKTPIAGKFAQMLNGSAASGRTMDEVQRVAKSVGLRAVIVDGKVELHPSTVDSPSGAFPAELVPDLTPKTGLIGSPEASKDKFLKFKCLLMPKIKPGRRVRVVWSTQPTGLFVLAKRVTHTGDTRGQEWYTEVEGAAL